MVNRSVMTAGEVARTFNVSVSTVNRWANKKLLPYFKTPGGNKRYYRDEIEKLTRPEGT